MDVSQAFKCLSEATDEAIYEYDQVDIVLRVTHRLAKAVSRCRTAISIPSHASTHGLSIALPSHHVSNGFGSQPTNNGNSVQQSVPLSQDDTTSNPSGAQTRAPKPPAQARRRKAISIDISWLWNLRNKDVSRFISENRSEYLDARINDIICIDGNSTPTKEEILIVRTAQRSFALQFIEYEHEISPKKSRIMDIHVALHSQQLEKNKKEQMALLHPRRGGLVRKFVKDCICPESSRYFNFVVNNTNAGIKQLSLELESIYRYPSINPTALGAVTSMMKDIFKNLDLLGIVDFITDLYQLPPVTVIDEKSKEKSSMHICHVINEISPWYESFQRSYDQHVKRLNQGRGLPEAQQPNTLTIQGRSSASYPALLNMLTNSASGQVYDQTKDFEGGSSTGQLPRNGVQDSEPHSLPQTLGSSDTSNTSTFPRDQWSGASSTTDVTGQPSPKRPRFNHPATTPFSSEVTTSQPGPYLNQTHHHAHEQVYIPATHSLEQEIFHESSSSSEVNQNWFSQGREGFGHSNRVNQLRHLPISEHTHSTLAGPSSSREILPRAGSQVSNNYSPGTMYGLPSITSLMIQRSMNFSRANSPIRDQLAPFQSVNASISTPTFTEATWTTSIARQGQHADSNNHNISNISEHITTTGYNQDTALEANIYGTHYSQPATGHDAMVNLYGEFAFPATGHDAMVNLYGESAFPATGHDAMVNLYGESAFPATGHD